MMKSNTRDEFSTITKDALAKRAAYHCSSPTCRERTLAPSEVDPSKWIYWGIAAHITSAASNGARYDKTLTHQERASVKNGIFLCAVCATKVDKNNGIDYSVDTLREWKQAHDKWVTEHPDVKPDPNVVIVDGSHSARGDGEITGLDIQGPAILRPGTKVSAEGTGTVTATRIGPLKSE